MKHSIENINKAYSILKNYNGTNSYLIWLKNDVFVYESITLNDFHVEYILRNHDFTPKWLGKNIKIAEWYGEKKKEEWETEFTPKILQIGYFMGETSEMYHVYAKYRQSQEKYISLFIPKTAVLTQIFIEDFNNKVIDFDYYNKLGGITLKPQQEQGIKFLTTRKKAILAHQMGGRKDNYCYCVSIGR